MITIQIDERVFGMFPEFRRGLVIATDLKNDEHSVELQSELRGIVAEVRGNTAFSDYKNHQRIAPWRRAFSQFGMNPNQNPPSIASLIKRVKNGKELPFINDLVALMNIVSLVNVIPVGGDDLKATTGNLALGIAEGNESYRPLGHPYCLETPAPGEVIYRDTTSKEVLCRGWCWRNSHVTRILPTTRAVAMNVDGLGIVGESEVGRIADTLAAKIRRYCGGNQRVFVLSKNHSKIVCDL